MPTLSGTKLHRPRVHQDSIRRPRLTTVLAGARPRLALVVAPPGYGKTSLLADWADLDPRPFAWLAIDDRDNDRAILVSYTAAALASALDVPFSAERQAALVRDPAPAESLAMEAAEAETDVVLVLDDCHVLHDPGCLAFIAAFIDHAPPNVQIVISSRADPSIPLGRLRASGDLIELRAGDLVFNLEETAQLLNDMLGSGLDPAALATLHERTEGWPAGLYLAYLSYRQVADPHAFVRTFGASNRHVGDYLTEQVLTALDADSMHFMIATSIVDQISGPLADALTGSQGSAERLIELERANVFLTPLDDKREWYRYHPLLCELLRIELRRTTPEAEGVLHRRASEWFEQAGDMDRAIRHAIEARDLDRASRLITSSYLNQLEWGRMATVASWVEQLGDDAVHSDAGLAVVKAWTMHFLGRHDDAFQAIEAARRTANYDHQPDGAVSIESSVALMTAAFPGGDVGAMVASARRAFELESGRASVWSVTVQILLGFALVRAGRFDEAEPYISFGEELAIRHGLWMDAVGAGTLLARIATERGDPELGVRRARAAVDLAKDHGILPTGTGGFARTVLGEALIRNGQAAEAEPILVEALGPLRALREPLPIADTLLALAEAQRSLGRRREARDTLGAADALIAQMKDPGVLRLVRARVAKLVTSTPRRSTAALSERELDVLRLLAEGASKREAAVQLYVSFNTVHSHTRAIYRKLGVSSRGAALQRARELGLVGQT